MENVFETVTQIAVGYEVIGSTTVWMVPRLTALDSIKQYNMLLPMQYAVGNAKESKSVKLEISHRVNFPLRN